MSRKTGRDLRVARSMAELTQGQLGVKASMSDKTIKAWETTESTVPQWAVDRLGDILDWPTSEQVAEQLDRRFLVSIGGLTDWQFKQKLKGLGKYVEGVVIVGEYDPE